MLLPYRQVSSFKQRIAGKSPPTEKFAIRKARRYKSRDLVPLPVPALVRIESWSLLFRSTESHSRRRFLHIYVKLTVFIFDPWTADQKWKLEWMFFLNYLASLFAYCIYTQLRNILLGTFSHSYICVCVRTVCVCVCAYFMYQMHIYKSNGFFFHIFALQNCNITRNKMLRSIVILLNWDLSEKCLPTMDIHAPNGRIFTEQKPTYYSFPDSILSIGEELISVKL